MAKLTMQEKLHRRVIKKPSTILFAILSLVVKIIAKTVNAEYVYKAYPNKEKEPFVFIANHACRNDYLFTAPFCYPNKLNYVVGYNEFFRFPLGILLRMVGAIPKMNFTPDFYAMKNIKKIINEGGNICFMPEGMNSITGMQQPVATGTAKLLKNLGVNVYYAHTSGAYLTYPKHILGQRKGKCISVCDIMFTKEELKELSIEEIQDRVNRLLAHDDYIWNKKAQVSYKNKNDMAESLDTLLYMCPRCKSLHRMETNGNKMKCVLCGNEVELDSKYNLTPVGDSECPELVTDWVLMEREMAKEAVKDPNFSISEIVKIGTLPKYKFLPGSKTSEITGQGTLTLDHNGLHFKGTKDDEPFEFDLPTQMVPTYGMCTDISRFYTFLDNEFIEFFPEDRTVLRWVHLTEEMHRINGGKWKEVPYRHTEDNI